MYKIYNLKDPNTGIIMYIGSTKNCLQARLVGHLHEAYHRDRYNKNKSNWIKDLLYHNELPLISLIEETEDISKEKYYIEKFKPKYNIIFNDKSAKEINGREIHRYDLDGLYMDTYPNMLTASNKLDIDLSNICTAASGKRRQAGGYMWNYHKYDNINKYRKNTFMKEVHMYSKEGYFIKSYPSARHIKDFKYKGISKCCTGKAKSYKNYKFSFEKKEKI